VVVVAEAVVVVEEAEAEAEAAYRSALNHLHPSMLPETH
jgi:hypothetical protein